MAKRSSRITQVSEKSEDVSCIWGLFGILESCQGYTTTHKLISNGRPINKHIIDNPRKFASFDEECRKIKNDADLESTIEGQKSNKMDSKLVDHLSRTHKKTMNKSQKVNQSSLNKLKFSAILEAICAQNHLEEITLSEGLRRNISAKALMDQMFIERKLLCKQGTSSESQSFSHALEVLNSNKDLWQKIDYQYKYPFKTSCTAKKPLDKIVILKPGPLNTGYSENVTCHFSSVQSKKRLSLREMTKKLKHTFGGISKAKKLSILKVGDECNCHGADFGHSYTLCNKKGVEFIRDRDIAIAKDKVRKKLDFSSERFTEEHEFDVIMEAKMHLSRRLKSVDSVENLASRESPKTLGRILSSPDHDIWPRSPRMDGQDCSCSEKMRFSPYCLSPLRRNKEVTSFDDYDKHDCTLEILDKKTRSSYNDNEERDTILSETDNMKCNDEPNIEEMNRTETIELQKEDEKDSFPLTPSRIYNLDTTDSNKHQEEHRSPVSVLDSFFVEDSISPSCITPRAGPLSTEQPLQPCCLDFEESSFESLPQDPLDQDYISQYVRLVLQASCLNWDNLSQTEPLPLPEELLTASLFDELIDFLPPTDCYFDHKLLFDHINEVLREIYRSNFCLAPWLAFVKPRIMCVPLEELVVDEIMNEAEFYLLPWTDKRTLDQLVSKDMAGCKSWLDVRYDTEQIVIDISDDLLEGYIVDVLIDLHT